MEKDIPCKWKQKENWDGNTQIKQTLNQRLTRDTKGQYIMVKGSIQQEDIKLVNIYAPNIGGPKCIKQPLTAIKEEINSNTIIVGDFNSSLTPVEISQTEN